MRVKYLDMRAHPGGMTKLTVVVDKNPADLSALIADANSRPYDLTLNPHRNDKSKDQLAAIWGKIGEIADALYADKNEIYHELLRRYGPTRSARIQESELKSYEEDYKLVDIKNAYPDGTLLIVAYKGLSQMNSAEASRVLDGALSECREIGIDSEVRHDW